MRHAYDEDRHPLILDPRDHAIVADPPPPVACMLTHQSSAECAGILGGRDPLFQRSDETPRDLSVERLQFLRRNDDANSARCSAPAAPFFSALYT
jgi:hypothetical protein